MPPLKGWASFFSKYWPCCGAGWAEHAVACMVVNICLQGSTCFSVNQRP